MKVAMQVRVSFRYLGLPLIEVVEHYWWTGRDHATQYTALLALVERCRFVCVDATGVGAGVASWLGQKLHMRTEAVQFTRPLKSEMGYELLAAVNGARVRMYADDGAAEWRELWEEARPRMPSPRDKKPRMPSSSQPPPLGRAAPLASARSSENTAMPSAASGT